MKSGTLSGKAAIVTGAARGLGKILSEDLAKEGVNIIGCDVRYDALEKRYKSLSSTYSVQALPMQVDVSSEEDVVKLAARAKEAFGKIDFLINNAGIRATAKVWETSTETWDNLHAINLRGSFLVVREVLNVLMLEADSGVIVNVNSGSGRVGQENCSAYCASKWGLLGFTESLAKDLKDTKIRACSITPGVMWTPMAAEQAPPGVDLSFFDPRHVSRAILFLLQQDADTVIPELRIHHRKQL